MNINKDQVSLSQTLKEEATKLFSKGDYVQAIIAYKKSIEALNEIKEDDGTAEVPQKKAILELNISICHYKLGRLRESLDHSNKALENNPTYVKALYRKAVVLKDLKNYEESVVLIKRILALEPSNKEALELMNTLRNQLVDEDNENRNPVLLLKKALQDTNVELELKKYKQYLMETIDTPNELLRHDKKVKLREFLLETTLSELSQTAPNTEKINYLFQYILYAHQVLLRPLFEVQQDKKLSSDEKQVIEAFLSFEHNKQLHKIFDSFTSIASKLIDSATTNKLHEDFIKLFRFAHIISLSEKQDIEEAKSLLIELTKFYENRDKSYLKQILSTVTECFRINLACSRDKLVHDKEKFDLPLVSALEFLFSVFKEKGIITSDYDCFFVGLNLYLKTQLITNYEEFIKCSLFQQKITKELLVVYSLLIVNPEIGSKHFSTLLNNKDWESLYLDYLSNPKTDMALRKMAFEALSLFIKDNEGCKDLLSRKHFLEVLIKILGVEAQPLFQLKVILLLVKLVLRQPTEEVVKQFEKILDATYFTGLFDYLLANKDPNEILEFVELIVGLSYVEDFKVRLSKIPTLFKFLNKLLLMKFEQSEQQNSLNLSVLLFLLNMVTDAKQENMQEQKKKFDIQDEDLERLENLINSSNQTPTMIPKYTNAFISSNNIFGRILEAIDLEGFCRSILNHAEHIKTSKLLRENLPKLFLRLASQKENDKTKLIRKDIIRVCLLVWDNSTEPHVQENIFKFLSSILVACNPDIFSYTEALQLVDVLSIAIKKSSHELTTFEATSSLVQFSSINEDICRRIIDKHHLWGTLIIDNLCEGNHYVIHATLELLNNLSLSETVQELYAGFKQTDRDCKVIKALLQKYYNDNIAPLLKKKSIDLNMIKEINLFGNYNSLFQKFSLLIGVPVFLNFTNELIAAFSAPEELWTIFKGICQVLLGIQQTEAQFFNEKSRAEIIDFLYKVAMIVHNNSGKESTKELKDIVSEVVQKVLKPFIKEFSENESMKFKELLSNLHIH